ncbi:efflux RND transporter periplasmic adaptor subunit [Denitromonas iodatirespirans]|uniref:Efflux RND transporter periplasmic adaptor subunit n=1 Tax=Denitromonas iodatirespirans TaxID=2795389 RepID=A0A944DCY4_DENI1|nr:efflux RND transporter periplasmic adaptor subunit [Denitromonas iodatirespirans]MBT0960453.1 efflux RND transporter periplasmic adaptor subunit [Denitromonas iodatirespirans]
MTPDAPRPFRRRLLAAALLLALVAAGLAAWVHFSAAPPAAERYLLATVQRGELEDVVTATGTLQPRDHVDVGAQVSGQLRKIHVEVGEQVEAGALLAEIDPTVYRARVDERRAQLRSLRAQLDDRGAQLELAQLQARRQKNLIAADATTTEAVQAAEATLRSARAQIEALRAQIAQSESSLRADEANLDYARIYAPMAGTVVSITARQGQTLNTNQSAPVILRIADLSTMTVQTQVSEADIGRLRPGMATYFTTLGDARRRWPGTLEKIEPTPTVTNNVVLYNALFDVPNPEHALMTQMTAQVFFITAQARDALLVPMGAVRFAGRRGTATGEGRRAMVQVVAADGSLVEREVTIGTTNRIQAQVLSGLEAGEQVVAGLRDGTADDTRRRPLRGL